jgi:glutamine synthetase
MHINMCLYKDGKNAFYDGSDPIGLSDDARHFIGGIFRHIKGITALTNPLVNSYKRLVPGNEAPSFTTWARKIRSPLVRIPMICEGNAQLELLSPDSTCNPYLALSVLLAAGLEGIRNGVEPPAEATSNPVSMTDTERKAAGMERLPESLGDALNAFEKDELIRKTLGDHAFSRYLSVKRAEWQDYCRQVNQWELDRYLSIY